MSVSPRAATDSLAALRFPAFRWWVAASVAANLGSRALAVVIGFQVYAVSHSTLALGLLGLVEAIPALGLALLGGHFADRHDRRRIVLITRAASVVTASGLALASGLPVSGVLPALYALVFLAGIARGFGDPASSALETQLVPSAAFVNAAAWMATAWQGSAIVGPAVGGILFDWLGGRTYWLV
ncbi:MAG TPA: MFS transporter, partial [Deinococcales bacterium]|nr:MFS transporter [Deinococcales bacterium]